MIKIDRKFINADVENIVLFIKERSKGKYFSAYKIRGEELHAPCPYHKDGQEKHPSFSVHCNKEKAGIFHCFTCGESGNIVQLVSFCLNINISQAKELLLSNFENIIYSYSTENLELPKIELETEKKFYLNEKVLEQYRYIHPYVLDRGITEETIKKFQIGCTPDGNYITFPCWDKFGNLIGIFKRSTINKSFIIPKDIIKPVYLLNFVLNENHDKAFVCEGTFDALKMWQNGYPSIALFGAGTSKSQVDLLNSTGIRNYILCYDNDEAGRHGAERFKNFIRKDVFVTDILMPNGKDCADCSKEDMENILKNYGITY